MKSIDADKDVQAFENLRNAYEHARAICEGGARSQRPILATRDTEPVPPLPASSPPASPEDVPSETPDTDAVRDSAPTDPLADLDKVIKLAVSLAEVGDLDPAKWRSLLYSTALDDPVSARHFEQCLVHVLVQSDRRTVFMPTREFARLLDDRFGWASDGIGFLRRFPQAGEFQSGFPLALNQGQGNRRARNIALHGRPISGWAWFALFLAWAVIARIIS
ncbi:hypothetical protein [Thalassovita sp.]|uniref:hypothetical protein n=1 Tax=Thalassovita sp. TaxID=1979401 RepID=UPI0029DE65E4|nr:hypothetical protein [Thalassovita sp.]